MPAHAKGKGWFSELLGEQLLVTYVDGELTPESFDEYLRWLDADIQAWPISRKRAVFYEIPSPSQFGPRYRKLLADVLNRHQEKLTACTAGYALVTPSAIVRGIITATFWLAPPGYPTKICRSTSEAFEFLGLQVSAARHEVEAWGDSYEILRHQMSLSRSA